MENHFLNNKEEFQKADIFPSEVCLIKSLWNKLKNKNSFKNSLIQNKTIKIQKKEAL